jgi:hypothetical protein
VCVTPETRAAVRRDDARAEARREPGSDSCRTGFVWRAAVPGDLVCVDPATRDQTWMDNARAAERRRG